MMDADSVRRALEAVGRGGLNDIAAVHALFMDLYLHNDALRKHLTLVLRGAQAMAKELAEIRAAIGIGAEAAPAAAQPVVGGAPPPPNGSVKLGADGSPMTSDMLAAEAMMDAAAGPHPMDSSAGPPVIPGALIPRRGPGASPVGPPEPRIGADGTMLDPETAAAEDLMDRIAGPRQ